MCVLPRGNPGADPELVGGAEEIRTPDLRLAKAALSQLSYGPFREARVTSMACVGGLRQLARTGEPKRFWWAILDSNQRPQSYQDCALTS
jgi:hypothetical protein